MDAQRSTGFLERVGMADELQVGFNPAAHPIIARHFFGVEPFPIRQATSEVVANLRFRGQVQRLHRLGARAVGEFLAELGAERGVQTPIDQKLNVYVEIEPGALEVAGGDRFWPALLHEIRRGP